MKITINSITFFLLLLVVASMAFSPSIANCIWGFVGLYGTFYCLWYLILWIFFPIKRDWIMVKGNFMLIVINFVVFVPFALTTGINHLCKDDFIRPQDLVFAPELDRCDTIKGVSIGKLKEGYDMKIVSTATNDTMVATLKSSELLDSLCHRRNINLLEDEAFWSSILNRDVVSIIKDEKGDCLDIVLRHGLDLKAMEQTGPDLLWSIYYHYVDPGNQHMTTTDKGRRFAILISLLGILLMNGLLVSTIISQIDRRKEHWLNGDVEYSGLAFLFNRYSVLFGANEMAPALIKKLLKGYGDKPGVGYVIMLTSDNVQEVRNRIASYLTDNDLKRLVIYGGQLDSIEEINKMRLKRAQEIFVLGEDSEADAARSYHDTLNMKCVHNIVGFLAKEGVTRKIDCHVLFEYQTTYSVFQFSDLPKRIKDYVNFEPFSNYENWARQVLVGGSYDELSKLEQDGVLRRIDYLPIDGTKGIDADSDKHVHLIVVGMDKMGVAMAIEAAQIAHYPNFKNSRRTCITFIDPNAKENMHFFKGRYENLMELSRSRFIDATDDSKELVVPEWEDPISSPASPYHYLGENFIDLEWEFVEGDLEMPLVREYLRRVSGDSTSILTIAICRQLAHEAIAGCLYMPECVYDKVQQILVYQREASDILYNLYSREPGAAQQLSGRYEKLRPFGMRHANLLCNSEIESRAKLCNHIYDLFSSEHKKVAAEGKTKEIDAVGNVVKKLSEEYLEVAAGDLEVATKCKNDWDSMSIFNRWSNKYLADSYETKLRSVGVYTNDFTDDYDSIRSKLDECAYSLAECEHNRWDVQQLLMGFSAYRESDQEKLRLKDKDGRKEFIKELKGGKEKRHNCICPFHMLDKDIKDYDIAFIRTIPDVGRLAKLLSQQKGV